MSLAFGLAGVVALEFCIIQVRIAAGALKMSRQFEGTSRVLQDGKTVTSEMVIRA